MSFAASSRARAQHHQQPAAAEAGHGMQRMMEMHIGMIVDSVIARKMMADTTMRAVMQEMTGGMQMNHDQHGAMVRIDPAMRPQMMTRMQERERHVAARARGTDGGDDGGAPAADG